jgi:hypothetical protein
MFESWGWGDAGVITVWREFQWWGLTVDVLILIAVCVVITKRWHTRRAQPFPIFLGLVSGAFVWLNIEPWIFGAPLSVIGPPPTAPPEQIREFYSTFTRGFPVAAADFDSTGLRTWPAVANVAIGSISWSILFAVSRALARRAPAA